MKFNLTSEDEFRFQPHCVNFLARYEGPLFHQEHDFTHPLAFVNTALFDFVEKTESFLNKLDEYKSNSSRAHAERDPIEKALIKEYREIVYLFAEYFEALEKNVVRALCPKFPDEVTQNIITNFKKKMRPKYERAIVICNKLKHNHNRMIFVLMKYSIGTVAGYSVMHSHQGTWKPNPNIHKKCTAYSFNLDLRRLISDIFFTGYECGLFVKNIAELHGQLSADTIHKLKVPDRYYSVLSRISALPTLPFPKELQISVPLFSYNSKELVVSGENGPTIPIGGLIGRTEVRYEGDGMSNSFSII